MKRDHDLLKIGIVGCGEHSHEHFRAAQKLADIEIVACCDLLSERVQAVAEKYHCQRYYLDLETMLKQESLDAVILCTWPMQHLEQIEKCLTMGIKNILCEKALTLSGEEGLAIWKLVTKNNAFLMEGFKYRHHPAIHKLERVLSYGDLGNIDSIRATFSNYEPEENLNPEIEIDWRYRKECGGGVPYDWMSYLVNACNYFSGALPKRIFASGKISERYGVITRIFGMIEYENGMVGMIESSKEANFSQELQITCANGILRLPIAWGIYGEVEITQTHRKEPWDYILTDRYQIETANAFELQLKNFAAVIRGEETPVIPLQESIINALTIDALVTSISEQKVVEMKFFDELLKK